MISAFAPDGFYPFEGPDTCSLELIPLSVRHKLDCTEVKLHLPQWQALSIDERALLVGQACGSDDELRRYRDLLNEMIDRHHAVPATPHPLTGDEPWRELAHWPEVVVDQCGKQQLALPPVDRWRALGEADRHALFVLGRSKHSGAEFLGAMRLFFGI
jgi:hypothetical protein